MLIKVYDYRFVASEIQFFSWDESFELQKDCLYVWLKGHKTPFKIPAPKTVFGQFEEQYRKYLSMQAYKRN